MLLRKLIHISFWNLNIFKNETVEFFISSSSLVLRLLFLYPTNTPIKSPAINQPVESGTAKYIPKIMWSARQLVLSLRNRPKSQGQVFLMPPGVFSSACLGCWNMGPVGGDWQPCSGISISSLSFFCEFFVVFPGNIFPLISPLNDDLYCIAMK